jgi:dienelactone hydrolase
MDCFAYNPAMFRHLLPLLLFVFAARAAETGPWNLDALKQAPHADFGTRDGLAQKVYYEGEPSGGKPTRVFAYLARPEGAGPFPAMVLVHGGGGEAFKDWALHWAQRGYAALAMDTAGHGPGKARLADGGPDQEDGVKFRAFTDDEVREMWTYHAVAAVIRGHSLLASLPEVDRARIGITGISWGGYLTCIVAGLDDRLKVAVPVYGCGFLGDNSYWKEPILDKMPGELRARWLQAFDPSNYLPGVRCPILFLNGTNDFAYPLDSYRKCYSLVREDRRHVCVKVEMPHGHIWTFGEVDAFADSILKKDVPPPPKFGPMKVTRDAMNAPLTQLFDGARYELHYTTDGGQWQKRKWQTAPAQWRDNVISAAMPEGRPLTAYFSTIDAHGLEASSEHVEVTAP